MSDDGEEFVKIHEQKINKTGQKTVETKISLYPKQTKFLKVVFENYGIIPEGKQGGGHPAWVFIDEIVVN